MPYRRFELSVGLLAVVTSIALVAQLAVTQRAALLFIDADSMLPILVMRSLDVGQTQDWAMSPVLFIPELGLFGLLWLLRLGVNATVVLNAVVNFVCLYVAFRVVAGARMRARAPLVGAFCAFAVFVLIAACDGSASHDSVELASLLATTTYYSATVLAVIVSVGLLRRMIEPHTRGWVNPVVLGPLVAVSVLSNPLYLLWGSAPLLALLLVYAVRHRSKAYYWAMSTLVFGSIGGYAARSLFSHTISNSGLGYIDMTQAGVSIKYYASLVVERWHSPSGMVSLVVTTTIFVLAIWLSVRLRTSGSDGARFVAVASWVIPVFVVIAAILLGTHAARYLQPLVFAPVMVMTVLPEAFRLWSPSAGARRILVGVGTVAALVGLLSGIPVLAGAVQRTDQDLACVTTWVDTSGRTGAGQFWTVRLPKAHIQDARRLVQIDSTMHPYDWLVNRTDATVGSVSFLVLDGQSTEFSLPAGLTMNDADTISCGRYTIADFNEHLLKLGPPRS